MRRRMLHDNQPDNGGNPDIDDVPQREMVPRLKVLHDERNKLKVQKVHHQPGHQAVFTVLCRRLQQYPGKMYRFLAEEYHQYQSQQQQRSIEYELQTPGDTGGYIMKKPFDRQYAFSL